MEQEKISEEKPSIIEKEQLDNPEKIEKKE